MPVLLDTNIILRLSQPDHPHSALAAAAIRYLLDQDEILNITAQNVVEFWVVATRPLVQNGLGRSVEEAAADLEVLEGFSVLLAEVPLHKNWERLVKTYRVSGRNCHDARLVAAMQVHKIDSVLTFDVLDFLRYPFITVLDPSTLALRTQGSR